MDLKELKGIGSSIKEKLIDNNIKTVERLSISSHVKIANILECSTKKAKELIDKAKILSANAIIISTAKEVLEHRKKTIQRIPTGSTALDNIIGGGIETNALTAFTGQFATGKTQLCYSLILNCKNALDRKSAWIETEPQTFRSERILEMSQSRGIQLDLGNDILIIESKFINSCDSQYKAYELIERKIKEGNDIGLIVIDSFNALFRMSYSGRELLPERSADTAHHLGFLQYLASNYNCAIVMTIQVMGIPDSSLQLGALKRMGIRQMPVGPHILKHAVNYWIALDHISAKDKIWKAILSDGPMPRNDCLFHILTTGIEDVSLSRGKA
uniref:Putative DNA repair and recombination protein n=1 Tax=viral metagenome TaxID=1070528 RepID=A0A6H1ZYA1_9ZZZZ